MTCYYEFAPRLAVKTIINRHLTHLNKISYLVFEDCEGLTATKVELDNRAYHLTENPYIILTSREGEPTKFKIASSSHNQPSRRTRILYCQCERAMRGFLFVDQGIFGCKDCLNLRPNVRWARAKSYLKKRLEENVDSVKEIIEEL